MLRTGLIIFGAVISFSLGAVPSSAGLVSFYSGATATAYDIGGIVSDSIGWDDPNRDTPSVLLRGLRSQGTFDTSLDPSLVTSHFVAELSAIQTTENQLDAVVGSGFSEVFWFKSDTPLEVVISGTSNLVLSGLNTWGGLGFKLTDRPGHTIYAQLDSLANGQTNETVSIEETILLEGGIEYFLLISSVVFNRVQEFPGSASTAASEISLTIRVVPETSTILLLLLGSMAPIGRWCLARGMERAYLQA